MLHNDNIQEEVLRTLQSIDGIKRAKANPFLYTRLKEKMQQENSSWEKIFSFISRPLVAFAILILVMVINTWAVWGTATQDRNTAENNITVLSEIASEYNQVASTGNYEYEMINQ
jgi:hypothetical protein